MGSTSCARWQTSADTSGFPTLLLICNADTPHPVGSYPFGIDRQTVSNILHRNDEQLRGHGGRRLKLPSQRRVATEDPGARGLRTDDVAVGLLAEFRQVVERPDLGPHPRVIVRWTLNSVCPPSRIARARSAVFSTARASLRTRASFSNGSTALSSVYRSARISASRGNGLACSCRLG
jgi:hypothetical protein